MKCSPKGEAVGCVRLTLDYFTSCPVAVNESRLAGNWSIYLRRDSEECVLSHPAKAKRGSEFNLKILQRGRHQGK